MGRISKKRKEALGKFDRAQYHPLSDALGVVKQVAFAKFDESVDVAVRLGVNPKHADQMVRGALVLPNGTGKTVRVAVFARGEKEKEALDAGADMAGSDELAKIIQEGNVNFDRVIATPDMMGTVGKLGRILGPRGLMPNPKVGTVTLDVARAVQEAKGGKVEYRVDKAGVVHCRIGRLSFDKDKLTQNAQALINDLIAKKPSSAKGVYLRSVTVSSTMGPGVRVDTSSVEASKTEEG
ncbi:MAG TPA: 50S ribosomal protein L1 [Polyangiaceae bacterium]|jgi:large subunit ribosomal protein L1|nr:50S ribosomal protein L1 [Polyangiaceae bacterium]